MDTYQPYGSLAVALLAGLLIGFERDHHAARENGPKGAFAGGARTHSLVALVGALAMLLHPVAGWVPVALGLAGVVALLAIGYRVEVRDVGQRGLTSEFTFVVTYLLGSLATSDVIPDGVARLTLVMATAVVVTVVLSIKPGVVALVGKVSTADISAALKFLFVAVVVLPLLPDRAYGPLDILNPFRVGLMVVLIAGIDFVGYVAVRALGSQRGLGLTGLIGGFVSSTAVTLSMSARARADRSLHTACALSVVVASTITFPRVLLEVAVVNPGLVQGLALPLGLMTAVGAIGAVLLYLASRRARDDGEDLALANPFGLGPALKFGALFVLVLVLSRVASEYLGRQGAFLAGVLAGAADVDAITLSMAQLTRTHAIESPVAVTTIILATASNTIVKAGMAMVVGGWRFAWRVLAALSALLGAGALGVAWVWIWG